MIQFTVTYKTFGTTKRHYFDTHSAAVRQASAICMDYSVKTLVSATILDQGSKHSGSLYLYESPQKRRLTNPAFLAIVLKELGE